MKMHKVTKETFFDFMGPRNVHPRAEPNRSVWVNQNTRQIVGISTPGYLCEGEKTYHLCEEKDDA